MTPIRVGFKVFASEMKNVMSAYFEFRPVHPKYKTASFLKWKRYRSRLHVPRRVPEWMSAMGNAQWDQHPMRDYAVVASRSP